MFHETIHIGTIVLAASLLVLSLIAFRRHRKTGLLYLATAFLLFMIRESIVFVEIFIYGNQMLSPLLQIPVIHLMNLVILTMFFLSVWK